MAETQLSFEELVDSLRQVAGKNVIVQAWDGERPVVSAHGRLKELVRDEHGRFFWPVGDDSSLWLEEERFLGASRSAIDGGDYWGITIRHGDLKLTVTDDMHKPP